MSESIEQVRAKAAAIVARIKTDSAFKEQVEQNPESTLVAAGLPAGAVSDFLTDMQAELGDVRSYCGITCIGTGVNK